MYVPIFYCKNNTCFYNLINISTLKIIKKQTLYNIKMRVKGHFCHDEISSLQKLSIIMKPHRKRVWVCMNLSSINPGFMTNV
jgi:hypothetical protein